MTHKPHTKHQRILIVEDERPLAHALELKLQHEGYETVTTRDGRACLELLQQEKFDIVLLDLMLPVIDGFSVLKQLQGQPNMPVIFALSNLRQAEDEERVLALGAHKFFVKTDVPLAAIVAKIMEL